MKKSLGPGTWLYPTPVFVVGTYDAAGKPNVMTVAWGGICCSKPPCVAISVRKATYTYGNLMERRAFTISLPTQDQVVPADFFGVASGRDIDKFAAAGLTAVRVRVGRCPVRRRVPVRARVQDRACGRAGAPHPVRRRDPRRQGRGGLPGRQGPADRRTVRPIWWGPSENRYYATR